MEIIREKKNGKGYEVNSQKRKSKSSKCEEILPRKRIPLFVFLICQVGKELIANTGLVKLWGNGHLHCWCKLRKNIYKFNSRYKLQVHILWPLIPTEKIYGCTKWHKFIQGNSFQHYNSKRLETIYMFISKGQVPLHTHILYNHF